MKSAGRGSRHAASLVALWQVGHSPFGVFFPTVIATAGVNNVPRSLIRIKQSSFPCLCERERSNPGLDSGPVSARTG